MSISGYENTVCRACLVFVFVIAFGSYSNAAEKNHGSAHSSGIKRHVVPSDFHVQNVLEDFTLVLTNGEKVRLLGMQGMSGNRRDESMDNEITIQFVKKIVEGKTISLTFDDDLILKNHKDDFGRLVAYVWVRQDSQRGLPVYYVFDHVTLNSEGSQPDIFLNGTVVRAGYAVQQEESSFRFQQEFKRYEKEAREAKRGLWKR